MVVTCKDYLLAGCREEDLMDSGTGPPSLEVGNHRMKMASEGARTIAMTCDRCQTKMQTTAELLLISCDARPVLSDEYALFTKSYSRCRDEIVEVLRRLNNVMRDVTSLVSTMAVQWHNVCSGLQDISDLVFKLTECCCHAAYLAAINFPDCLPARSGLVDKYKICRANLDIKIGCSRLKRSRLEDLQPQFLVDICSNLSKALSVMTDACCHAGEHAKDVNDQEQFKLCVKSVTTSTSCLIASIKCFKSRPNHRHLNRIVAFCDPVITASSALVTFSTEDEFIGKPAYLTSDAKETQKSILGACMSIVSASVQTCRSMRDLTYDLVNSRPREKIALCMESLDRGSARLKDLVSSCNINDTASDSQSSSTASSTSSR